MLPEGGVHWEVRESGGVFDIGKLSRPDCEMLYKQSISTVLMKAGSDGSNIDSKEFEKEEDHICQIVLQEKDEKTESSESGPTSPHVDPVKGKLVECLRG
ncbi:hypothetical protein HAX54_031020 [Datura stramonium]|uniref:Uncharacterized protein n=1 Tax=Datura stramonium TaxID=4076 RepID=A0ABS8RLQ3_DATST|nr:hypothetical protein [Datura stramonium]